MTEYNQIWCDIFGVAIIAVLAITIIHAFILGHFITKLTDAVNKLNQEENNG